MALHYWNMLQNGPKMRCWYWYITDVSSLLYSDIAVCVIYHSVNLYVIP